MQRRRLHISSRDPPEASKFSCQQQLQLLQPNSSSSPSYSEHTAQYHFPDKLSSRGRAEGCSKTLVQSQQDSRLPLRPIAQTE
jgi:hypothetical protein